MVVIPAVKEYMTLKAKMIELYQDFLSIYMYIVTSDYKYRKQKFENVKSNMG